MTSKQKDQFNRMRDALLTISKAFLTPEQLRKSSNKNYGLDFQETLEMSYENMQNTAKAAVKNVKAINS